MDDLTAIREKFIAQGSLTQVTLFYRPYLCGVEVLGAVIQYDPFLQEGLCGMVDSTV